MIGSDHAMRYGLFRISAAIGIGIGVAILAAWSTSAVEIESPGIEAIVQKHFPAGSKGGMAVLVIKDKTVIHSKGYGLRYGKTPITPQTRMGLASVSKQFAAMCAAFLIEEGKLRLTDKVSKHLPNLRIPRMGRELRVQDLVWHINGLPNFINAKEKASIERYKKKHGLERLNNQTHAEWLAAMKPLRAPGLKWEYTNSGYVLLARIIEVVAGKPFHQFQKERILDVLGMTNTTDSTRFNGSGNMTMPLEDYAKWDRALWDGTLLNDETTKLLFQSGQLDNGDPVGYAFGWHVVHEAGKLVEMSHGGVGSAPGSSRNMIIRDPRNRITVAFFARENLKFNRSYRSRFAEEIRDQVRDGAASQRDRKPSTKPRAAVLAAIERLKENKQPSVSGGSLRTGLLKNAAELPTPEGVGYYLAHPTRGSNFGNDRLVFGLMMLGAHLQASLGDHPYHRVCIRDMSSQAGGKIRYHINHQMGLDADLTFFATDRQGNPVSSVLTSYGADGQSTKGDRRFDVARNWEVVEGILQNEFFGEIRALLIADPLKQMLLAHANAELKKFSPEQKADRTELKNLIQEAQRLMRQPSSSPHDNHLHLSLRL
jgi:CubicO group peptidase (beta-lactamase class C family)